MQCHGRTRPVTEESALFLECEESVRELQVVVARPPVPGGRRSPQSPSVRVSTGGFIDATISEDSAAFVSYMPLTSGMGRFPMQILFGVLGVCSLASTVLFGLAPFEVDARNDAWARLSTWYGLAYAGGSVVNCVFCVGIVILSRCGKPRHAVVAFGVLCLLWSCLHVLMFGAFAVADVPTHRFSRLFTPPMLVLSFGTIGVTYILYESRWITAFIIKSLAFIMTGVLNLLLTPEVPSTISITFLGWGIAFGGAVSVFVYRRHRALQEASAAVQQDRMRYDESWAPIKQVQEAALRNLEGLIAQHQNTRKEQRVHDFAELYAQARVVNEWYQDVVRSWAQHCNARHSPAPMKTPKRAMEKIHRSYSGRVPPILDVVRSSIVVDTVDEVRQVLELVLHDACVHSIKNRFDTSYDGSSTAGYRDLNLQLGFADLEGTEVEGFIFELQIHLRDIIEMKTDFGHKRYIALRNLTGD